MTNSQKQKENKSKENKSKEGKEGKENKNKEHNRLNKKTLKKKNNIKRGGGGINDLYSSDDYKDSGFLDSVKFSTDDRLSLRGDMPPFPGCSIM